LLCLVYLWWSSHNFPAELIKFYLFFLQFLSSFFGTQRTSPLQRLEKGLINYFGWCLREERWRCSWRTWLEFRPWYKDG
jgi:hypothetical protein